MDTERILAGLDTQQRDAVTTDAAPLAILAAAGSGKTRVLTSRIAHRVVTGSADARHVLAITFTRDAAGELRRRLRRLQIAEPIESGTFHAVALRLLRDRASATGTAAPVVATDRTRLIREVLTETRLRCDPGTALAELDWVRARAIDPADVAAANRSMRRRPAIGGEQFIRLAECYTALKRRRGVVDFDDLLERLVGVMESDQTFADIVRWRFRHLFVDEAQDLNPLQFRLLEQLRGGRADICLVGDPRQAIYGWNGADPTLLDEVERHLPGVTVARLRGNYRCTPQVVRLGAAALSAIGVADDTESRRGDGPEPKVVRCADEGDEARAVAADVTRYVQRHGARHVAVLARTNEQLAPFERALAAAGIATVRSAGTSSLDRCLAEVLACRNRDDLASWVDRVWADDTSDPIRTRVAEEVDRFLAVGDTGSLRAWFDLRHPFDDLEPDDSGAVSVLTFHAAKGREWSAVFVTGVEAGLVPHNGSSSPAQRAEEARLLHVALTRASDDLVVTWAASRSGAPAGPSPWLEALEGAIVDQPPAGPSPLVRVRRPADPLEPLRAWRAAVARRAGVADSAVCPDRVLRSLHTDPPVDAAAVAARLGIGLAAAERLAPELLDAISRQPGRVDA